MLSNVFIVFGRLKLIGFVFAFTETGYGLQMFKGLTSLAEDPDTSIQVFEKNAQDPSMKTT